MQEAQKTGSQSVALHLDETMRSDSRRAGAVVGGARARDVKRTGRAGCPIRRHASIAPLPLSEPAAVPALLTAAQEALLLEHVPLVRRIARSLHERLPAHVELEELVGAGMLGLVDAAMKFSEDRSVQFQTYAQLRIRGAILDALRSLDWGPRALRRKGREVREATRSLQARLGREPSDTEVATEAGMTLASLQQLSGELNSLEMGSLHVSRGETESEQEIDFLPARASDCPLFRCLEGEARHRLMAAMEHLAERERLVITLYYFEEMTMKQIGLTLGVVESRISQVHQQALGRLKNFLRRTEITGRGRAVHLAAS